MGLTPTPAPNDPAPHSHPLRVGLTGGIGSGKSTVASFWQTLGATLIDTDAIARALTARNGAAMPAIRERFGAQAIDASGAMDRAHMRHLAFSAPQNRLALEAILHPMIGVETEAQAAASKADVLVFDVPLLVESGRWRARVHKVLVVDCLESTQVRRVMTRSGWALDAVEVVIGQQATRSARLACADAVIYNEALDLADLQAQVQSLWKHWHR